MDYENIFKGYGITAFNTGDSGLISIGHYSISIDANSGEGFLVYPCDRDAIFCRTIGEAVDEVRRLGREYVRLDYTDTCDMFMALEAYDSLCKAYLGWSRAVYPLFWEEG